MRAEEVVRWGQGVTSMQWCDLTPRCATCGISEKAPGAWHGSQCQKCYDFTDDGIPKDLQQLAAHRRKLRTALQGVERAGVYLSGGKDSAYVLSRLLSEYPSIEFTAISVDNGFTSEIALANAVMTASALGVDLVLVQSELQRFRDAFRRAFRSLGGNGCYNGIDAVDGKTIFQVAEGMADRMGLSTVICGLRAEQLELIIGHADVEIGRLKCPMVAWQPPEHNVREYVTNLELVMEADPLLSNSDLVITMFALDYKRLGYSTFEPEFCRLVREGKADKATWLRIFEKLEYLTREGRLDTEIDRILCLLGLTQEEIAWDGEQ